MIRVANVVKNQKINKKITNEIFKKYSLDYLFHIEIFLSWKVKNVKTNLKNNTIWLKDLSFRILFFRMEKLYLFAGDFIGTARNLNAIVHCRISAYQTNVAFHITF